MATYSDIEDGDAGTGNIAEDPPFVDAAGGDYHLAQSPPCINHGTNAAPGLPAADYDGDARVVGGIVDMGADECIGNTGTGSNVTVNFAEAASSVRFDSVTGVGQATVDKRIGYLT